MRKENMEIKNGQLEKSNVIKYLFAGNSTTTVLNEQSGNRFTFKITELGRAIPETKKEHNNNVGNLFFIKVLTGQDNNTDYRFIGSVSKRNNKYYFKYSSKAKISADAQSVRAFTWIVNKLETDQVPDFITFYHEGRCGRCGKKLTAPESVSSGYGPECIQVI